MILALDEMVSGVVLLLVGERVGVVVWVGVVRVVGWMVVVDLVVWLLLLLLLLVVVGLVGMSDPI